MLEVTQIQNGIVLDHISPGNGLKIFNKLMPTQTDNPVVLLMNVSSEYMSKKDIIKIENIENINLEFLGLIDEHITINTIENGEVIHKKRVTIPKKIKGILTCHNPRCITHSEPMANPTFELVCKESLSYQCEYCETVTKYTL
ncbi:aspartate carbamoyltransferase regulatory subunit [Inediibacterium massiliense]|uniref:aspartate carbamoyltransferase regulatory subunit n=1 Tax=Inediibacterium massiliense TaxID=1658111 RepID=UPI0006B4C0B1|nr:aspartate carbamoyltransferase regulatory subunit [Inediibacterium massiliense]